MDYRILFRYNDFYFLYFLLFEERTIPPWIIPFGIVIATAFCILLTGCIYLAMFQTRKGFNIKLWEFFKEQEDGKRTEELKKERDSIEKKTSFDNPTYDELM